MFALRLLLVAGASTASAAKVDATAAQMHEYMKRVCMAQADTAACTAAANAECKWESAACVTKLTVAPTQTQVDAGLQLQCTTDGADKAKCDAIDYCKKATALEGTFATTKLDKTAGTTELVREGTKGTMGPINAKEGAKYTKDNFCSTTAGKLCKPCLWDATNTKCVPNVKLGTTAAVMITFKPDICAKKAASNGVRSATMFGAAVASMFALIMA